MSWAVKWQFCWILAQKCLFQQNVLSMSSIYSFEMYNLRFRLTWLNHGKGMNFKYVVSLPIFEGMSLCGSAAGRLPGAAHEMFTFKKSPRPCLQFNFLRQTTSALNQLNYSAGKFRPRNCHINQNLTVRYFSHDAQRYHVKVCLRQHCELGASGSVKWEQGWLLVC